MPNPTTVGEYSRRAAENFVQTAVFVDDAIYNASDGTIAKPQLAKPPVRTRKAALKSAAPKKGGAVEPAPLPPSEASPQDILVSFAKKRVVCSLYEPKKNASVGFNSDAYAICSSADIVIVDWDLYGDRGTKAKELIKNLIEQSLNDVPQQIRLILVYTAEHTLSVIASEVYEELKALVEPTKEDRGLAMHSQNTRVVILGKPTRMDRAPSFLNYVVAGENIADRALDEFGKLAGGLLQGVVLEGLGEIRRNSRRMLSKFDASLDAAFLTHRALSMPHEDANEHIWPMMVDQIESILADCIGCPQWDVKLLRDWCDKRWTVGPTVRELEKDANKQLPLAKAFCEDGPAATATFAGLKPFAKNKEGKGFRWAVNSELITRIESLLLRGNGDDANRVLAQLMSQRTHYAAGRELRLGTILKNAAANTDEYLICLQPVCDGIRLDSNTAFIFCSGKPSDRKVNTIATADGKFVGLNFRPSASTTVMKTFAPHAASRCVVAAPQNDKYIFETVPGEKWEWIAELKPEHAQRAAEQFAREISRVGLTESEWLRLNAK